jgi:hypothetical protein
MAKTPPSSLHMKELVCRQCSAPSSFDGIGGEWCAGCQSTETLISIPITYVLLEEGDESDSRVIEQGWYECSMCGSESSFNGNGGEWCAECETSRHLVAYTARYEMVAVSI